MTNSVSAMHKLRTLPGFRACGKNQYEAKCPAHKDENPSLSIGIGEDGKLLLDCKAGCSTDSILKRIGLTYGDLFPGNGNGHHAERNIVAQYDYLKIDGSRSYQVVRFEPKDFRQRQSDGKGGWNWSVKGLKRIPYNLPELVEAEYVWIVEGEKDVESLRKIGLVGTCNSGGSGKWTAELSQYFRSDQIITIIPDNDTPGQTHADLVAKNLHGKVASIKILNLEGLAEKGDVSDWLQGRDPETAAEELSQLSEAAPEWTPKAEEKTLGFQPPEHWELLDVANVDDWQCEPLEWIIEQIVAKGNLVFIAADTQCGKTLLALYISLMILTGGLLFGKFQIHPIKRLLYLLLEDPSRRAKARIQDIRRDLRIKPGQFMVFVAPGLTITDDLHFDWLKDFISKQRFDFVILDTYQKATPGIASFDDVKQGPVLHRLANLTRELNVTIWIHDHYRKDGGSGKKRRELDLSSLKGTGGKPQNADSYILMERNGDKIKVLVSSKDTDHKPRFLLRVSPEGSKEEKFQYIGDLEDSINDMKAKGQANRNLVYEAVENAWASKKEIAARLKGAVSENTVGVHLSALVDEAKIERIGQNRTTRYRKPTDRDENLFRAVE